MSKEGIKIVPERVKSIPKLSLPTNKKVHSFFGKVNFLRRFIPDFAKKTPHISNMIEGSVMFHRSPEAKIAFKEIKEAILCQVGSPQKHPT